MAAYNNFIYVYGGVQEEINPSVSFGELWKYNTATNTWSNVTVTANTAGGVDPLAGAASTVVGTTWFIYGGNSENAVSGKFYSFDFTTETFHEYFSLGTDGDSSDADYELAGGCMTSIGTQWYTFGGTNTGLVTGITPTCSGNQIYGPNNVPNFEVEAVQTVPADFNNPNGSPPATLGHLCFPDINSNILVFFSACQLGDPLPGVVLSTTVGNNANFIPIASTNTPSSGYRNFVCGVNNNRVSVFFGGWQITNSTPIFFNDTQIYTAATGSWQQVSSYGPSGRRGAGAARIGSYMYIFGGVGADPTNPGARVTQNDMWTIQVNEIGNSTASSTVFSFFIIIFSLFVILI